MLNDIHSEDQGFGDDLQNQYPTLLRRDSYFQELDEDPSNLFQTNHSTFQNFGVHIDQKYEANRVTQIGEDVIQEINYQLIQIKINSDDESSNIEKKGENNLKKSDPLSKKQQKNKKQQQQNQEDGINKRIKLNPINEQQNQGESILIIFFLTKSKNSMWKQIDKQTPHILIFLVCLFNLEQQNYVLLMLQKILNQKYQDQDQYIYKFDFPITLQKDLVEKNLVEKDKIESIVQWKVKKNDKKKKNGENYENDQNDQKNDQKDNYHLFSINDYIKDIFDDQTIIEDLKKNNKFQDFLNKLKSQKESVTEQQQKNKIQLLICIVEMFKQQKEQDIEQLYQDEQFRNLVNKLKSELIELKQELDQLNKDLVSIKNQFDILPEVKKYALQEFKKQESELLSFRNYIDFLLNPIEQESQFQGEINQFNLNSIPKSQMDQQEQLMQKVDSLLIKMKQLDSQTILKYFQGPICTKTTPKTNTTKNTIDFLIKLINKVEKKYNEDKKPKVLQ